MYTDIAWDFDGTLCDSYPHITYMFQQALRQLGVRMSMEELDPLVSVTVEHAEDVLCGPLHLDRERLHAIFREGDDTPDYGRVTPFPGVREALQAVLDLGGRNHLYTHRRRASVYDYLDHYDLTKYFSLAITADDGYPRKPDPAALKALMREGSIPKDKLMMVGDRPIDIDAAWGAGCASCFFNSHHLPVPAHATWQVDDYPHFIKLLHGQA